MASLIEPVPHLIKNSISKYPQKTALMYPVNGEYKHMTYAEMGMDIDAFSRGLIRFGLDGKQIAIVSENGPQFPISEYGTMSAKGIFVPVYERQTKDHLIYVLNDSGASAIVVSNPEELSKVRDIRKNIPNLQFIFPVNDGSDYRENIISFEQLCKLGGRKENEKLAELYNLLSLDDLAKIIYTSGTTGEPKGALFNHLAIAYNALASIYKLGIDEKDVTISYLPLAHSLEANNQNVVLFSGGAIAYSSRKDMPQNMLKVRPTVVPGVPFVFERIYNKLYNKLPQFGKDALKRYAEAEDRGKEPGLLTKVVTGLIAHKLKGKTGGNIRFFISGGAPLDAELSKYFEILGLPVAEGYGLTEFCPVVSVNDPKNIRHGFVGTPLDHKIKDKKGNSYGPVEVKLNGEGQLLVRGPSRMIAYWKKPELTQETIDEEGWLRTGDLAEMDNGHIKISGRKKELVVLSTGENVPLGKIEGDINNALPGICSVVVGDKRPYPVALLFPQEDGVPMDRNVIERHLKEMNENLPRHEQIRKFALADRPLREGEELTPTLKVKRRVVQEIYKSTIDKLYSQDL